MTKAQLGIALAAALGGCRSQRVPEQRFYDQHIQPILNNSCVGNTSPCHRIDEASGMALGNLDLSSFESVRRRPDVLRTYGSYPQPLLLMKALPEETTLVPYRGVLLPSEIRHAGGKTLAPTSEAFYELKRWLDNGATRDGLPVSGAPAHGEGACSPAVPADPARPPVDTTSSAYQAYAAKVAPLLAASCAFGTCHSSPQSDFHITCGTDDEQQRFNFLKAASFVADAPTSVDQSEILLRPLSPRAGGVSHTGGVFFDSRDNAGWKGLREWALEVQQAPPPTARRSAGEQFFGDRVMPVLLQRGCALEGCHSPNGFNDFRLRSGAQGFFSPLALRRNYQVTLDEFMSLDTPDVTQSRAVKKTIFTASGGLPHRGGPVLETGGGDPRAGCPSPYDPATASAFCTLREWHRIERQDHAAQVSGMARADVLPLVFIARPADPDAPVEFDTFRGGADLVLADAHLGDGGRIERVDGARSALGPCAGLGGRGDLDVRGPEWSPDARRVVFAVRQGAGGGHDLWLLDVVAGTCRRLTDGGGAIKNGVRLHSFDPVFAPDGSLVFASTRAGTLTLKRLLPNADLYRVGSDLDFSKVEQMTFLSNSELAPAFMKDGRVSFTAEKASPDFYQLSGRRLNWDLTDYHPLLAQRARSDDTYGGLRPSVGYQQATEIREGLDGNFLLILSDAGARGAGGALASFNRSVGPFEEGRVDVSFLKALAIVDRAATGRAGTRGVYRSPSSLPNGEILASYAAEVRNPAEDTPRYDLYAVEPGAGGRRLLLGGGALSRVEPALGAKRADRRLFRNVPQLVFGGQGGTSGSGVEPDKAVVHFPDLPLLATLLDFNLRRGRNVDAFDGVRSLRVYEAQAPPDAAPPGGLMGAEQVYTQRIPLGTAALEPDRSLKVEIPSRKPLVLELLDGKGAPVFTMREEHQLGPGERITPGVPRRLFNGVCGGCHGSVSGDELDVAVTPDALTGASASLSRDLSAKPLR